MFYKLCNRCGKKYPEGTQCSCKGQYRKGQYKLYDEKRRDSKEWKFYRSQEWIKTREYILVKYKGLDLFEYYMNSKIVTANTVHHIIELKDDWNKRLDIPNLFPCSDETHRKLHKMYRRDKKGTQMLLNELIRRWESEWKGEGVS